jgi:hypothetical protein
LKADRVTSEHSPIISSYIIKELQSVARRRFPGKEEAVDRWLSLLPYEIVHTPKQPELGLFETRNEEDFRFCIQPSLKMRMYSSQAIRTFTGWVWKSRT